jgi:ABC-type glycerol-3-phosphate transport system substrate-binding protein
LLQARLDEFVEARSGVQVEVRVKALTGEGGMLNSLSATSAAAPLALPDLIALPRELLESAALRGLLSPYDDLSETPEEADWYPYALELAQFQNSIYGLPFAGDALIHVYRPEIIESPPRDWGAALDTGAPMVFPAVDPMAHFTLALYQAGGGSAIDDQGNPILEPEVLAEVLTFYMEAEAVGVTPFWLTQYQNDDQAWEAFLEPRSNMVVTWGSRFFQSGLEDTAAAQFPTRNGRPFTLATGWVWALATPQTENQETSIELAAHLTDSEFLAEWTQAAGYLPTDPEVLAAWPDSTLRSIFSPILASARLFPSADILASVGPPLQSAVVAVLKQEADPLSAAQTAASSIAEP